MRFAQAERRALVIGRRAGRARLFAAAFICALVPLVGCDRTQVAGANPSSGVPATVNVVTAAARREPMGIEIEAVGTTRANESVEVTSKASNTVIAIRFNEGEDVERGAVSCKWMTQARGGSRRRASGGRRAAGANTTQPGSASRQALSMSDLEQVEATPEGRNARVAAAQVRSRTPSSARRSAAASASGG